MWMCGIFLWMRKISHCVCMILILVLISTSTMVYAQDAFISQLPQPGKMMGPSPIFTPILMKGLKIDTQHPLNMDVIVDTGHDQQQGEFFQEEMQRNIQYFLAAIGVKEDDLWVNLSVYEQDKIIEHHLSQTALGRDMLAQDYVLKQISSSLIHPQKGLGKDFWKTVYQKMQDRFGTTDIPIDMFQKIWIVPDIAQIYEKENIVYITKARLKLLLASDDMAMLKESLNKNDAQNIFDDAMREIIIPMLEQELNEGKTFALMRQIYHAVILAKWYRERMQDSIWSKFYIDQKKLKGVVINDGQIKNDIYQRYTLAYQKGVFNIVEEDGVQGDSIPKKYFAGGEQLQIAQLDKTGTIDQVSQNVVGRPFYVKIGMEKISSDASMVVKKIKEGLSVLEIRHLIPKGEKIHDLVVLGSDDLEVLRYALRVYRDYDVGRIVLLGGVGRLTESLRNKILQEYYYIEDPSNEATMMLQVMRHMIANEEEFSFLVGKKIDFFLEKKSTNTVDNFIEYKKYIQQDLLAQKEPYKIVYLQIPHQQLRTTAAIKKVFSEEIETNRLVAYADAPAYDFKHKSEQQMIEDLFGEVIRYILYPHYKNNPIAYFPLPDEFFAMMQQIFVSLSDAQRNNIIHLLFVLMTNLEMSFEVLIKELPWAQQHFLLHIVNRFMNKDVSFFSSPDIVKDEMRTNWKYGLARIGPKTFDRYFFGSKEQAFERKKVGDFVIQYNPRLADEPLIDVRGEERQIIQSFNENRFYRLKDAMFRPKGSAFHAQTINAIENIEIYNQIKPISRLGHLVVVPMFEKNRAQYLIKEEIQTALGIVKSSPYREHLKVGFNSSPLLSALHQLYLQTIYYESMYQKATPGRMPVEEFPLAPLIDEQGRLLETDGVDFYEIADYPMKAFVLEASIQNIRGLEDVTQQVIQMLQQQVTFKENVTQDDQRLPDVIAGQPYHVVFTKVEGKDEKLRVYIFLRQYAASQEYFGLGTGVTFLEMSGEFVVTLKTQQEREEKIQQALEKGDLQQAQKLKKMKAFDEVTHEDIEQALEAVSVDQERFKDLKEQLIAFLEREQRDIPKENPSTYAITGATGAIGTQLLRQLLSDSQTKAVFVLVRGADQGIEKDSLLYEKLLLEDPRVHVIHGDLLEESKLKDLVVQSDVIYHLGGWAGMGSKTTKEAVLEDVVPTLLLSRLAKEQNKRLIFASTVYFYSLGAHREGFLSEENLVLSPDQEEEISRILAYAQRYVQEKEYVWSDMELLENIDEKDLYAWVKLAAERIVIKTPKGIALRFSNVYGPGDENPRQIPQFTQKMLYDQKEIAYTPGRVNSFIFVKDVVQSLEAAGKVAVLDQDRIINVSAPGFFSQKELLGRIKQITHSKTEIVSRAVQEHQNPPVVVFDTERMSRVLGLQQTTSLQQGLDETQQWFRKDLQERWQPYPLKEISTGGIDLRNVYFSYEGENLVMPINNEMLGDLMADDFEGFKPHILQIISIDNVQNIFYTGS